MTKFFKEYATYLGLPFCYILSAFRKRRYNRIEAFCCFIGYGRSGHTIVGSMLDAHPDIVISTEANAFKLISQGYRRNALYFYLEFWSKLISVVLGNKWSGYDYHVKGWFQGRKKTPLVIGDKKGNNSRKRIIDNPTLCQTLSDRIKVPVKYVHVIRNPFDNIATMHNRKIRSVTNKKTYVEKGKGHLDQEILERKIGSYFRKARDIRNLLRTQDLEVMHVHHEDLIAKPRKTLRKLIKFLGVKPSKEYLQACAGIVFENPHKSRHSIEWPEELKNKVLRKSQRISFLKDYSFEE